MKRMIVLPTVTGITSALMAYLLSKYTQNWFGDLTPVSYTFAFVGVAWAIVTATLLARVDDEWKNCQRAVLANDKSTFDVEVQIEMGKITERLWKLISLFTIVSFHFFSFENQVVLLATHFLVAFTVSISVMFVKDLDTPTRGVVNLEMPKEWY